MGRSVPAPRLESRIELADGRHIGLAEYGVPDGKVVLWFHGTPGGRRQMPVFGREAAAERGIRLVMLERPGVGGSTPHTYSSLVGWARDVDECADGIHACTDAARCVNVPGSYSCAIDCTADAFNAALATCGAPTGVITFACQDAVVPIAPSPNLQQRVSACDDLVIDRYPVDWRQHGDAIRGQAGVARWRQHQAPRHLLPALWPCQHVQRQFQICGTPGQRTLHPHE